MRKRFLVATYNCNSIRTRLPLVLNWLSEHRPDVVCLQETKVPDREFPTEFLEQLTAATEELKRAFGAHADMWQVPGRIH